MKKHRKQSARTKRFLKTYRRTIKHAKKNLHAVLLGLLAFIFAICLFFVTTSAETARQDARQLARELNAVQEANDCQARDTWTPGTTKSFTITSGGLERHFLVHLPAKFSSEQSYPLILGFAGKGGTAQNAEAASQFDSLPVISVYPQALIGKDGVLAWQGAPYSPDTDDVAFIRDILDRLEGQLCIQKPRIYSAGLSNGGGMSWVLSCKLSDRIAAFAMFAGAFYYPEANCKPPRAAAILNVHGDADPMVPYGGSFLRQLPDIESWVAERARSNRCKSPPNVIRTTATTTVTTWADCEDNATVRNVRLHGVGHVWPETLDLTAKPAGSDNSAKSLLDFFLAHPLY